MALFRSRQPPGRLFLTRADGRSLRRELPPGQLERFAERVLAGGDAELLGTWRRAGQASSAAVLACWPAALPLPERAMLGAGDRKTGPWLEARFGRGVPLEEVAADFARHLSGAPVPEQVEPEGVESEELRAPPERRAAPAPAPAPKPAPAPIPVPVPEPEAVAPPAPATPEAPRPEVLAPGARIAPARAQVLREQSDDVFGLWGEPHPADTEGDSPELRAEDLPWLCPGDRLYSPRRGSCRLLALENERGRWRLRDERGREIEVSAAELTAEFSFDDEPAPEP